VTLVVDIRARGTPEQPAHMICNPQKLPSETGRTFLLEELRRFKARLEELTGAPITSRKTRRSSPSGRRSGGGAARRRSSRSEPDAPPPFPPPVRARPVCPQCLGPMTVIACLTDPALIEKILTHLRLPARPPPPAPARLLGQMELFDEVTPDEVTADRGPPCRPQSVAAAERRRGARATTCHSLTAEMSTTPSTGEPDPRAGSRITQRRPLSSPLALRAPSPRLRPSGLPDHLLCT